MITRGALLAVLLALALGQTPALASPANVSTTRSYIQANYALVQFSATRLGTAQTLLEGVLYKVKALCPDAGAQSPQDPESTQMSNEVIGAMVIAAIHPAQPEIDTFLRVAERSQWSSRALTRAIHEYARKLKTMSKLAAPNLCGDVTAWAASGFKTLPASTVRFDQQFVPNWVALGELPASLRPYEQSDEAATVDRSHTLEMRITNFEAGAVETWGEIMNALNLYP